jgi:hypothetical protein
MRLVQEVRDRAHDACVYCLLPQNSQEATFHIDHVLRGRPQFLRVDSRVYFRAVDSAQPAFPKG